MYNVINETFILINKYYMDAVIYDSLLQNKLKNTGCFHLETKPLTRATWALSLIHILRYTTVHRLS